MDRFILIKKRTKRSLAGKVHWVELAHPDSSPRVGTGVSIYLCLFQNLISTILTVVCDVSVDSEASVVISSISMIYQLNLMEILIWVRLCACIHGNKCVYGFVSVCVLLCFTNA